MNSKSNAGFVLGVGLAVAALVDLLAWLSQPRAALLVLEPRSGDLVAIAAAVAVAYAVSEQRRARLLVAIPAALYVVVHAWHVLALPPGEGADLDSLAAAISRLRIAHLLAAGVALLGALGFAAMHRQSGYLRDLPRPAE
ncbi:MAG: hypothetical protein K8W52_39770 [Deltaproteobacteria bacterium]|nr:hypothetical protein [Deltaproteobacteria bacterium]